MSDYLSDREQEEALRNWWRENWRWVMGGVVLGFIALAGWNYWQRQTQQKAETAAEVYRELSAGLGTNDKDKIDAALKRLDSDHSGSPYADQAHLLMAQAHVNAGRFEQAAAELKTVAERSKDDELKQIAKLRLARVELQLGRYDEALVLLDVNKAGAFAPQVHEVRGDALLAKGDASGARAAYQAAVAASQEVDPHRAPGGNEYLQLKLQDLAASAPESAVNAPSAPSNTTPNTTSAPQK